MGLKSGFVKARAFKQAKSRYLLKPCAFCEKKYRPEPCTGEQDYGRNTLLGGFTPGAGYAKGLFCSKSCEVGYINRALSSLVTGAGTGSVLRQVFEKGLDKTNENLMTTSRWNWKKEQKEQQEQKETAAEAEVGA